MFTTDWLTLREPADARSRSRSLTRDVVSRFDARVPLRAADLAAGTGANARYLAGQFESPQEWLLVDHAPFLLATVPARMALWASERGEAATIEGRTVRVRRAPGECSFTPHHADLRTLDDRSLFATRSLVTASALLDLVSESWMCALAGRCREVGAVVLFALTYDGRMYAEPAEPEDGFIHALVNQHQRTDKGFGIALGPDATASAERCFSKLGYVTRRAKSDWILRAPDARLQRQLISGWADAAASIEESQLGMIRDWQRRRLALVDRSELVVGHEDFIAWPF